MKNVFFLHIPKTAGTAFNDIFIDQFPAGRWFEHMESRPDLLFKAISDGEPFFASGHFSFERVKTVIQRSDVYAITILRDPIDQLISHIKWVKGYGAPTAAKRRELIPENIAAFAQRLWAIDLNNMSGLVDALSSPVGISLFDNLQTRYMSSTRRTHVDEASLREAKENILKFDIVGTFESIDELTDDIMRYFPRIKRIAKKNKSPIDEKIDLPKNDLINKFKKFIRYDIDLYNYLLSIKEAGENAPFKYGPINDEVRITRHENAIVTPKKAISDREFSGEVYTQHGELVADSLRPSRKAAFVHKAIPPNLDGGLEGPFLPGRSLFLGHVFEMFGHDLIEFGTRCWPALKQEVNFDRVVVLKWREGSSNIQVKMSEPAKTIIDLLFGSLEVHVSDAPVTRFEELYVPSPAFFINDTYHSICSSVFEAIAQKSVASANLVATDGKIYLSRSRLPGKKRFEFEDAIERAAKEAGYIIVHPESFSLRSQIDIMRNAEFISGLDGSAMHLCAFARPRSKVLCFDTRQVTNQFCIEEIMRLEGTHVDVDPTAITNQVEAYDLAKHAFRKFHL